MPLNECDVLTSKNVDARITEVFRELKDLEVVKRSFPGSTTEWNLGVTLVRGGFLVEYIKIMAAKCLDLNSWPLKFVDWEKAVEDYKKKYDSVHFGDIIYWIVTE